jgi:M6 family metalloprotease-like protein
MATLLNGRVFTFTQPDGSTIQLRGFGDQNYAVFETLDGYTVTKNPATGYYGVAQLSPDGNALEPAATPGGPLDGAGSGLPQGLRVRRESAMAAARESVLFTGGRRCDQRREERRQQLRAMRAMATAGGPLLAPPQRQTVGDFVGLCLLIDFSDSPATIAREEVERFCNLPGYTGFGNQGSVFDFYRDNSIGRCRYTNVVAPYYRALHPKTYYTNPVIPYGQRAIELITEALTHHKANGFNFSPLTVDNQSFVYATNIYYAGPNTNNWSEGLWPHAHHLGSAVTLQPGKKAFDYQFTAMGAELTLGTFCHENGHMLCDYPDLYDYGYESSGVGGYCLMCGGNNVNEKNPIPISAYLKRLAGWARTVTPLEHGQVVTLDAGTNDFAIYARGGREYFLIENRNQTGRDASLPDSGLAIWHVDEDGDNRNEIMTIASHYELSLEQADGLFQLERLKYQIGDANDLFAGPGARFTDGTTPDTKWWNGTVSNLSIDTISAAGPSMTFRALLGAEDPITPPQTLTPTSTPNLVIPDNIQAGISDVITIANAMTISSFKVSVDITHSYRGDLRVTLTTPWGTVIELHPKGRGGTADDLKVTFDENTLPALATLRGRNAQGAWRLTVQDLAAADTGRLNRWGMEISAAGAVVAPVDLQESPGLMIPDATNAGIERGLPTTSTVMVGSLEVSVDITHPYVGDLRVSILSPGGSEVLLHDHAGGSADNLVRTFTAANTPGLVTFAGQPVNGTWRLRVADQASQDIGKLNNWRVLIKPPAV